MRPLRDSVMFSEELYGVLLVAEAVVVFTVLAVAYHWNRGA